LHFTAVKPMPMDMASGWPSPSVSTSAFIIVERWGLASATLILRSREGVWMADGSRCRLDSRSVAA
jgi:hypothetical protein